MKISCSWLRDRIEPGLDADRLADRLTGLGLEVASVERTGPTFTGVVTAEVLAVEKHPNADRLSLCRVTDGSQTYSVVCGAPNVAAGQKVPLARIGAVLSKGKLKKSKIRGVVSEGMICSAVELGTGAEASGIMVLDPTTEVGRDAASLFGAGDTILDVEVTPNRPDCLSHLGLARELSVCLGIPLKDGANAAPPEGGGACLPIEIEAPEACPRYQGLLIEDVEVGESPAWLKARLESVGLRPVNSVVDITNYVLMDTGQPLHAFDADLLEGPKVIVRFARKGEKLKALDGKEYALTPECLVIADAAKPVAVAGVMGGEGTSVTAKTTRVLLEAAHFAPPVVRRGSQRLRLRSDSSFRFERGCDAAAVPAAASLAASLMKQHCGPSVRFSAPLDVYPRPSEPVVVRTTAKRINEILGTDFGKDEVEKVLGRLSSEALDRAGDSIAVRIPSWRKDLASVWDLAEEIARVIGYDKVPARLSPAVLRPTQELRGHAVARRVRHRLAALGLHEAFTYDFVAEKQLSLLGAPESGWARLANPLTADWTVLRPSLLPGLLDSARRNKHAQAETIRLFELGHVYDRSGSAVEERTQLAGVMLGPIAPAHWKAPEGRVDLFEAKAALSDLLSGIPGLVWSADSACGPFAGEDVFLPGRQETVRSGDMVMGRLGELHPRLARAWDLDGEAPAVFEVDLDSLARLRSPAMTFRPFSAFPSSWRDLSLLVPAGVRYGELEAALRGLGLTELSSAALVDVYAGKGVPEGQRSISLRLNFCLMDRTLKDAEVTAAVERILDDLKKRFGAQLRT